MINYENYNLPGWIGVSRKRPMPYDVHQPLFGKSYTSLVSDDYDELPATWKFKMLCTQAQAISLVALYNDVQEDPDKAFEREVNTEFGRNLNEFRFIMGKPQPRRVGNNLFEFDMELYSNAVNSEIPDLPEYPVPEGTPRWSDWNLPDFIIDYEPSQIDPVERTPIFGGPLYEQKMTIDLPVIWDVELLCKKDESRRFAKLVRDELGVQSRYFIKEMRTHSGRFEQYLRIISGIPQGRQVRRDVWRFEMTLESPYLNLNAGPLSDIGV